MVSIKRWELLFWLLMVFILGGVLASAFSKVGWNCTIDATRSIEICTRGVLL